MQAQDANNYYIHTKLELVLTCNYPAASYSACELTEAGEVIIVCIILDTLVSLVHHDAYNIICMHECTCINYICQCNYYYIII